MVYDHLFIRKIRNHDKRPTNWVAESADWHRRALPCRHRHCLRPVHHLFSLAFITYLYIIMKNLKIPYLPALEMLDASSVINVMERKVTRHYIDQANWESHPYMPVASFNIARSDKNLYIYFFSRANSIRAIYEKDGSPVYLDSCVEFFVKRPSDEHYINFEFNCIGTCDASFRLSREEKTDLTPEQLASIRRYPSLPRSAFNEKAGFHDWSLLVIIPFDIIGLENNRLPERILGNFYKCGDATAFPHYLSWSPIKTEQPDFHRPEFFGELTL